MQVSDTQNDMTFYESFHIFEIMEEKTQYFKNEKINTSTTLWIDQDENGADNFLSWQQIDDIWLIYGQPSVYTCRRAHTGLLN